MIFSMKIIFFLVGLFVLESCASKPTLEQLRAKTAEDALRHYPHGPPRPRFNLIGDNVGWDVNRYSSNILFISCGSDGGFSAQEVYVTDTEWVLVKPFCKDFSPAVLTKICDILLIENHSSDAKATSADCTEKE